MVSPALAAATQPVWRIWHPYDDKEVKENQVLQVALLAASDHFPVSVDLTFADNPE
jgi:endonuclease/exonuclease/phosphatase family metal-dependent hydrolase